MGRLIAEYLAIYNKEKLAKSIKVSQCGSKFCRILNKGLQNCPRLLKMNQNSEILPNLVTLRVTVKLSQTPLFGLEN